MSPKPTVDLAMAERRVRLIKVWVPIVTLSLVEIVTVVVVATSRHRVRQWWHVLLLFQAVILVMGLVLFGLLRWRRLGLLEPSPLLGVDRTTRRTVGRAIRQGRRLEDPDLRPLAIASAESMMRRKWMIALWIGLALVQTPRLFEQSLTRRFIGIATVAIFAVNAALWTRMVTRAKKSIAANWPDA